MFLQFDNFANKLGIGFGKKDNETLYNENGSVTKDKNGNYIDANGNIVESDSVKVRSTDTMNFSDRLK